MRVLGVEILSMTVHFDETLVTWASLAVALRHLQSHGLPGKQLQEVTRMANSMYSYVWAMHLTMIETG